MKLRLRGDSLRVRVSPSELDTLVAGGTVIDVVHFGPAPDQCLRCEVVIDASITDLDAELGGRDGGTLIRVRVPADALRRIAASDEVGLSASKSLGAAGTLALLFEKDFRCLVPRADEDTEGFSRPDDAADC